MILYDLWAFRERKTSLGSKVLGYCFLSTGILGGTFFLFQGLSPLIGYVQSGAVVCSLLAFTGGILLLLARRKQPLSHETLPQQALSFLKDLDVEKMLKEHALSLSLFSFGAGVALSQFNNPRKLLDIYKTLLR